MVTDNFSKQAPLRTRCRPRRPCFNSSLTPGIDGLKAVMWDKAGVKTDNHSIVIMSPRRIVPPCKTFA